MLLRNKKTGEIGFLIVGKGSRNYLVANDDWHNCGEYNSLAELNEEWEDYEEPKGIKSVGAIDSSVHIEMSSKEEAEIAVRKLRAWKRLKDKGFRFTDYDYTTYNGKGCGQVFFNDVVDNINEIKADLDLLFGGEE